jgi:hypothetical protein
VAEGLGGGRAAVRGRHGHKGGHRRGSGSGDHGRWHRLQRDAPAGCLSLRDPEPLGQGGPGAGRGSAEGTQRGPQHGQEPVAPRRGFALDHPAQAPLHHLKRLGLEGGEKEEEPLCRRRQGAGLVHGKPARGARLPIHAPRRPPGLVCGLEGRPKGMKRLERHAGQIQKLGGAGLQVSEFSIGHGGCLLSLYRDVSGASYHKAG